MGERIRLLVADGAAAKFTLRVRESPAARIFSLILPESEAEAALRASASGADAILCYQAGIAAPVIQAAPSLRLIQKHGINCRNIDVAAATQRKVRVATLPLMRSVTVAEHALALMLACARKVIPGHQAVAGAVYREMGLEPIVTSQRNYRGNWPGIRGVSELFQASAGIVGMGDIGMEIAKRCRAFGMNVCYYQRTPHASDVEASLGIRYLPLDALLSASDYVVLVIPHTPESEGLIGARELARMKPSATLINVGRGGLIDEGALFAALQAGRIAMAGLDVYRNEPLPATSPLLTLPNVVLLPHMGGGSYRGWEVDIPAALRNIQSFFAGGKAEGIVNA
ncbi:MAG: D-glycerate dehydrogenase [Betaproteobacteria bacterium]|nr:D-glycerate dehydrogenase [Betaproteobacteria bacterium]